MCDTLVSIGQNNSNKNVTYFAKNSDREPDELQVVEHYERTSRSGSVRCTYIDVKFEGEANAVTISRPGWMWGAEMGINEHGVAIGNEAIFTRRKFDAKGLTGMDLLRLGLESGNNAREAMSAMVQYLEEYGQGGSNSSKKTEYYDNSFLISDWDESYILETFGSRWRYFKVRKYGSVSNAPVPGKNIGIRLNRIYTYFGRGRERSESTRRELEKGNIDLPDIMSIMRMHHEKRFSPKSGSNRDICMHAGGITRKFQTANSMIVEMSPEYQLAWFTFSPNPCLSLYKPVFFGPLSPSYGSAYWESSRSLHDDLSKTDWNVYSRAMEYTVRSQEVINGIVSQARERISRGEILDDKYISEIYENVREIDNRHIQALRGLLK